MTISRRNFIAGVSAASGGVALSSFKPQPASAEAPRLSVSDHAFHRLQFGDLEIVTLSDGRRPGDAPEKIYAIDQEPSDVAALLEENLLPPDRFVNSFTPVLINNGQDLILFDTGFGLAGREAGQGMLAGALNEAGYRPEDVTLVILSHFHPDHIGGLMENGSPAFVNARYATSAKEYDFWTDPARMGTPAEPVAKIVESNVRSLREKMTFLDDGNEVAPGIHAVAAYGHTPGHMAFHVESNGQQLVLISDTANHFVITLQRPDWHVVFDTDKEMAAATRKRMFDMLAAERLPFIGYHMPFPALAYLERKGEGYRFVPETYQLRRS